MMVLSNVGRTILIVVAVLLIVAVVAVTIVLLYIFVFSRNSYKKQIKELEEKYAYCDALLTSQVSQYVARLEMISRTNLLYVEKYSTYSKKYREVYDSDDEYAKSMIKQLKSLVANKQYKNIKFVISDAKKAVGTFEEALLQLDKELAEVVRPEEEARTEALKLKESFRRIKQIFYSNANDLELVANSFNKVFEKLEQKFVEFDQHIDSAEYEEANTLLPEISTVIKFLSDALSQLPNLCIMVQQVTPEKIEQLNTEYLEYERKGIPLFNLSYRHKAEIWKNTLATLKNKLIQLDTRNVMNELNKIHSEIEQVRTQLQKEVDDKNTFEKEESIYYQNAINLEKDFLKICSLLPSIKEIYIISVEQLNQIEILKTYMNNLGSSKRALDNYMHSGTKQPYSVLKEKLEDLKADFEIAHKGVQDFTTYIDSLKNTVEEAYSMIFVYYYSCKQAEAKIREIDIPSFGEMYQTQIETCYSLLNEIDSKLKVKPIDVTLINEKVEELKKVANQFFDEIENKYREMQLAESAIVYANRDRQQQSDVHQQLCVLEKSFFNGEFMKVYHDANAIYRRMHVGDDGGNGK